MHCLSLREYKRDVIDSLYIIIHRIINICIDHLFTDKLAYYKHLHGGVIFVNQLPRTVTGKLARAKIMDMVLNMLKIGEKTPITNTGNVKKLIDNFQKISIPVDSRRVPERGQ